MADLRRTPFHAKHVAAGARMVPFAGFDMPVQYTGVKAEHLHTRATVGLFDVSHMGEIRVRGPNAEDSLMWLLSNAIRRLKPGRAQYNALCNHDGGVVDDVFVYRLAADDFMVCVNAANRAKDWAWIIAEDRHGASFEDQGDAWAQLAIQGPRGVDVVDGLVTFDAHSVERHAFRIASFAGIDGCVVARTGYTGEDGFEVFIPAERAESVWAQVLDAGAEHDIVPVGLGARDTLRLEVGNCLYGHELTDQTTPLQAGLGWITKLRKPGGFIGCERITARQQTDAERLVAIVMEGKRIAREGMAVLHGGEIVGRVTSGTLGPSVARPIALAYVRRDLTDVGTALTIDVRGRHSTGVVHDGPFHTSS